MAAEGTVKADWFAQLSKPHVQALGALAVMVVFVLVGLGINAAGDGLTDRWGYQTAATAMMMFGVGNALMSLNAPNIGKYWSASFVSYLLLAGIGVVIARLLSGFWLTEAGSYKWIYMVLTFGYLVLLSIVSMMKGIVSFAEREEWSQPRRRE